MGYRNNFQNFLTHCPTNFPLFYGKRLDFFQTCSKFGINVLNLHLFSTSCVSRTLLSATDANDVLKEYGDILRKANTGTENHNSI